MGLLISSLNRTSISIDPAMGRRFNSIPSSLRSILSVVSFGMGRRSMPFFPLSHKMKEKLE